MIIINFISYILVIVILKCGKILKTFGFNTNKIAVWFVSSVAGEILDFRNEYDPLKKRVISKVILEVPSFGCAYYFKGGGCAMCGFNREIEKYHFRYLHPLALESLIRLFLIYLKVQLETRKEKVECISIFMAGSFINEDELPFVVQETILDFVIQTGFKKLEIESRAEYVIKNKMYLRKIQEKLKKIELCVSIGLESVDNKIREKYVKKKLTLKQYEKSVAILKEMGIYVNTYILYGSPYLSVNDIFQKTLNSFIYAIDSGSDLVSVEVYCAQEGTPWFKLYQEGNIEIPHLKSVVKLIVELNKYSSMWYLGRFSDRPKPVAVPVGCSSCTKYIMGLLDELRLSHDVKVLEKGLQCVCCSD